MTPLNILFLYDLPIVGNAGTINDHASAFSKHSKHNVLMHNLRPHILPGINWELIDVVVIHYSILLTDQSYLNQEARSQISAFRKLKVVFIQDEYRNVNLVHQTLNELKIDLLFTCIPKEEIEKVYPKVNLPHLQKVNTLTGYVPEALLSLKVPPVSGRAIDIGYRARRLPYWLGELGQEKVLIADGINKYFKNKNFKLDISCEEGDRIYGSDWINFVANCRSILGTESGASVIDFSGALKAEVEAYINEFPKADFEDVRQKFFPGADGTISMNQISPRCFEAACLRTPMILFEGSYSGILQPFRHFFPLKKDFSNIKELEEFLKDHGRLQKMADRTFIEVAQNEEYSYRFFIKKFDRLIEESIKNKNAVPAERPYPQEDFHKNFKRHYFKQRLRRHLYYRVKLPLQKFFRTFYSRD